MRTLLVTTCCSMLVMPTVPLAKTLTDAELKGLASQFVTRLAPKIKQHNRSINKDNKQIFSVIPDGEILLFRPKAGNFVYDIDIMATKQSGAIFISLYDFISVFEFPITYDLDSHKGFGWFQREDWSFNFDLDKKTVSAKGKEYKISDSDIYMDNNELFVKDKALETWFDMTYKLDTAQQYIHVYSDYPLPKVAQYNRQKRESQNARHSKQARLPRKNVEYDNFDINLADITLRQAYTRPKSGQATRRINGSLALEGEVLQHSAYALTNADNQQGLNTVVARLKKESENPNLLGPLKARSYTIGDTTTTRVPLTGSTSQELGVNISNNPLTNNDFETTQIQGDALPGWDVELYRNGTLVSSLTVNEDGRYLFENIQLFGGDNTFELFFYGPQGEIRSDNLNVPVNQALLSTQNNTYEFSASLSNERTYRKQRSDDPDAGAPHISGRYNFFLGDALSYAGFRSRQVNDEQKTFLAAGVTKIIKNAIIDANIGVDDQGETAGKLTGRTKIKDWDIALSGEVKSDEYSPDDNNDPQILNTSLTVNKKFTPPIGTNGNISGSIQHTETASGSELNQQRLNISNSFGRLSVSNSLLGEQRSDFDDRVENTLSMRYNYGKLLMRGGLTYDIKPEAQVDKYFSQFVYRPQQNIDADLRLDHEPDRDFSEARLNLGYKHKNVRVSPYIGIDSNDEFITGVSLNSTIVNDESYDKPIVTSDKLIGKGLVSAFVYHDKNGDLVFNEGDEALPQVLVESVNVRRRETTDKDGKALITSLPDNTATDIRIDPSTLPDPFMISATEGHSIFPRGGDIVNMDFPVHVAGEVDGIVSIQRKNGSNERARLLEVKLIPTSGDVEKVQKSKTAGDGFYVFSQVPPGEYLLTPSYKDLKKQNIGQPVPEKITIGFDGTVHYGKNIQLSELLPPTPFKTKDGGDESYVLNIGDKGTSKLSGLLGRMMARTSKSPLMNTLKRIKTNEDAERYTTPSGSLKESFETCQKLLQENTPCEIEQAMLSQ